MGIYVLIVLCIYTLTAGIEFFDSDDIEEIVSSIIHMAIGIVAIIFQSISL
jgi:hypothetical protein